MENGSVKAQARPGRCYDCAVGVDQDYDEAVRYNQLAADKGNTNAMV